MDPDRLRTFVETEYPRVVGIVALLCGDASHAEDSVQEALARACEQEERGVTIQNLAAWVTTVATNDGRTRFRRRQREYRALQRLGPRMDPPAEPAAVVDVLVVQNAVAALPLRQRQAIALRYFLGLDLAAIARELGIAEGTVKALLHQGRRRLAQELEEPAGADAELQIPSSLRRDTPRARPGTSLPRMGGVT